MNLYRATTLIQIGPGEIFALSEAQLRDRAHRVRVIEKAGEVTVVSANELLDVKAGEVIGLPAVAKNLVGKVEEIKSAAPIVEGKKTAAAVENKGGDRIGKIVAAIGKLNPNNRNHYRSDGLPAVASLEKAAGFDITAAERDEAWRRFSAKK